MRYRLCLQSALGYLYSAPMCQFYWWIPIHPLGPDNTMAFHPRYFKEAGRNHPEVYNYCEWNTNSRAAAAQHIEQDTHEEPKARQDLEPVTERYLPHPAELHPLRRQSQETVPNIAEVARYSLDSRTVHYDNVAQRRGARNFDPRSTGTTMRDYFSANDLTHLPEQPIGRYDDETAKGEQVICFGDRLVREAGR